MARVNVASTGFSTIRTHEGAQAWPHLTPMQSLRRAVLSCFLWEKQFYCDGVEIAERIIKAAEQVPPVELGALAIEVRNDFHLRHVPLLLLEVLSRTGAGTSNLNLVSHAVSKVVQRADEMGELLAVLWAAQKARGQNKRKVPHGVLNGLQIALRKFDRYQFAKYDRDVAIKLRDVLRLARPKPESDERSALWKQVVTRTLPAPDTWEVKLSGGADKKQAFTDLLIGRKLGYFALLRNLRNMSQAGVDEDLVKQAIVARKGGAQHVLPVRYVAAARAAPQFEPMLDQALMAAIEELPEMPGRTVVLVDVSRSMLDPLSGKSDMTRMIAAASLASIVRAADLRVFTFTDHLKMVPPRRGMAGVDAVINSQQYAGTHLFDAVAQINRDKWYDRLIVITDEQATDPRPGYIQGSLKTLPNPNAGTIGYMVNVGSNANGVGYGAWVHIDGFSERVLTFIDEYERDRARRPRRETAPVDEAEMEFAE